MLALDVTSEDSMLAALAEIDGSLDVLTNNAVPVTPSARVLMGLRRVLPNRACDKVVGSSFKT